MHTRAVARLLILTCMFASALGAVQLTDDANGFRVEIPDSLAKVRVDTARYPDTLHIYAEAERGGALLQFMQLAEELRPPQGNPPKDASSPAEIPVLWRGNKLMRRHRYFSAAPAQAVEISVDVPVARRGIRIALTGPTRREIELVGMFTFVLEHFDARSNWTPNAAAPSGPSAPAASVEDSPQSAQSQPDAAIGIAAAIALVLGFVGGWWLRGLGARPAPPPVELPKPEPPKLQPVAAAAMPVVAPRKPPDETDPGNATPKCRVCGAEVRAGKKVCMNCGSEVF